MGKEKPALACRQKRKQSFTPGFYTHMAQLDSKMRLLPANSNFFPYSAQFSIFDHLLLNKKYKE